MEFQTVGAAKLKALRPIAVVVKGTCNTVILRAKSCHPVLWSPLPLFRENMLQKSLYAPRYDWGKVPAAVDFCFFSRLRVAFMANSLEQNLSRLHASQSMIRLPGHYHGTDMVVVVVWGQEGRIQLVWAMPHCIGDMSAVNAETTHVAGLQRGRRPHSNYRRLTVGSTPELDYYPRSDIVMFVRYPAGTAFCRMLEIRPESDDRIRYLFIMTWCQKGGKVYCAF